MGRRRFSLFSATLATVMLAGGCLDADPRAPEEHRAVAGGLPGEAEPAFRRYGCQTCHTIPGVQGANSLVGPPLTAFARRRYIGGRVPNEPDELVRWILNPQEVKPGTAMPNLGVTGADAKHMAAYLYTLR